MHRKSNSSGFTLIELLVTLGISSLLLVSALTLPSYWVKQSKFLHHTNQLLEALEFARSYAMISGSATTICSSDGTAHCAGTAYEKGWIIFAEHPDSTNGVPDHGEDILMVQQSIATDLSIRSKIFSRFITYNRFGRANFSGRFILCTGRHPQAISELVVNQSGRARSLLYGENEQPPDNYDCLR